MEDESDYLQFGYTEDKIFYGVDYSNLPEPSAWNRFPTAQDPSQRYKFTSIELNFSQDLQTINRQTYSVLDWLGDMGGLIDAIYILGMSLLSPFSYFALKTKLLYTIFRYRLSDTGLRKTMRSYEKSYYDNRESLLSSIKHDFQKMKPIKIFSFFAYMCCWRSRENKILLKAESSLMKEMDLRKFIIRQRL